MTEEKTIEDDLLEQGFDPYHGELLTILQCVVNNKPLPIGLAKKINKNKGAV